MKKSLIIKNMMCLGCVNRIKNTINNIKGVKFISCLLEEKMIFFSVKDDDVFKIAIDSIKKLGFCIEE